MLNLKDSILKVLLVISSSPFIFIFLSGINGALSKDSISPSGWDGFLTNVVYASLGLTIIGILPLCLIYQIFYLIRHLIKKKKLKEKEVDS